MEDRQALFASRLESFSPVSWELIPDFGLYMDQVVTFVERQCKNLFMEGERVFTPAMVNNYVKFGLVNRPVDKKYGRDQLAQLLMICILKQAASADGMKILLKPPEGINLQTHYEAFCQTEKAIFTALGEALPFPSPMTCAVQGAAYLFLCNALLAKPPEPNLKTDSRHAPKSTEDEAKPSKAAETSIASAATTAQSASVTASLPAAQAEPSVSEAPPAATRMEG